MHITQDIDFELQKLRTLAWRMDALFKIPGTQITIGLDNIVGLVPVVGDTIAHLPSLYLIYKARQLGATPGTVAYMTLNVTLDWIVGSVPIVGDVFDALYNANIRNFRALEANLEKKAAQAREVGAKPHLTLA